MPLKIPKDLFSRIFARLLTPNAKPFDWSLTQITMTIINELKNLARTSTRKNILTIYWIALADIALTASIIGLITLLFI